MLLVEVKRIGRKMIPYNKEDYLLVFLIRLQIIYRTIDRIQIQKYVYKYVYNIILVCVKYKIELLKKLTVYSVQ